MRQMVDVGVGQMVGVGVWGRWWVLVCETDGGCCCVRQMMGVAMRQMVGVGVCTDRWWVLL